MGSAQAPWAYFQVQQDSKSEEKKGFDEVKKHVDSATDTQLLFSFLLHRCRLTNKNEQLCGENL